MKNRNTLALRPRWRHALWGALLGLLVATWVWAPARWLAWGVAQASQGRVQLLDPRNGLWTGSAQLVLSGGSGSRDAQALPGRLRWRIQPTWSGLQLLWRAECCMTQTASVELKPGLSSLQVSVSDHLSQWPAALLTGLGAPWNTLQAEGQLQWRTAGLELHWSEGRMQMKGQVELQVQQLSSRLSTLKPMGSYLIHLNGRPEGTATPELLLSTLQGPLLLSGQGQWVGARLRFTGEASAQEGHEAALSNLLNIVGRRQGPRSLLSLG
jgi:general secretion pathway protein N